MKRILTTIMLIIVSLIIPVNVRATTTNTIKDIDITKNSNLSLNYYYDDYIFDNTNVKLYYIADITNNSQYQLSSNFSNYSLKINSLTNDSELKSLKETINTYITIDNIKETISQDIKNNTTTFINLKPGLYFIKTDEISNQNFSYLFDTILISVPNLTEDGDYNYDIEIYPKVEKQLINKNNPDTGDNISLYFYLLIFSFLGLIILIVSFIFKRNKVRGNS